MRAPKCTKQPAAPLCILRQHGASLCSPPGPGTVLFAYTSTCTGGLVTSPNKVGQWMCLGLSRCRLRSKSQCEPGVFKPMTTTHMTGPCRCVAGPLFVWLII